MFKRSIGLLLALTVCFGLFAGCEGFGDDREYEFCSVAELYTGGVMSYDDLLSVFYYVNDGIPEENEDAYPEGFVPAPKTPAEIDEGEFEDIMEEYLTDRRNYLKDAEFALCDNYGTYGDYTLIQIVDQTRKKSISAPHTIFGVTYKLNSSVNFLIAYKKAGKDKTYDKNAEYEFFNVKDLYEAGELSLQDVASAAYINNYGFIPEEEGMDSTFPEDFAFTPKNPVSLSAAMEKAVAKAYKTMKDRWENYHVHNYLGTYGDYIVACLQHDGGAMDVIMYENIGGINFRFADSSYELVAFKVKK